MPQRLLFSAQFTYLQTANKSTRRTPTSAKVNPSGFGVRIRITSKI